MGQLAEDMVEGRSCSMCGVYFVKSHGFPVICTDCFLEEIKSEEGSDTPVATEKEL